MGDEEVNWNEKACLNYKFIAKKEKENKKLILLRYLKYMCFSLSAIL